MTVQVWSAAPLVVLSTVHPGSNRGLGAELIFTDIGVEEAPSGDTLSWRALNECGVGQDFVFQVPGIEAAVEYGLGRLRDTTAHWEGTALLVVGSEAVVGAARRYLERTSG